jgi:hypothetical protein
MFTLGPLTRCPWGAMLPLSCVGDSEISGKEGRGDSCFPLIRARSIVDNTETILANESPGTAASPSETNVRANCSVSLKELSPGFFRPLPPFVHHNSRRDDLRDLTRVAKGYFVVQHVVRYIVARDHKHTVAV